ncbi:MAG: hypothetical protein H6713_17210 [Myxococcales bacterium]|nr:hypothetical protein [Myxococcales bacterium]
MRSPPRSRCGLARSLRRALLLLLSTLAISLVLLPALAPAVARADREPVIEGGREREILGLLAPHGPGGEAIDGWRVHSVRVDMAEIHVTLKDPGGGAATLVLAHHERPGDARSGSFSMRFEGVETPEARAALQRVSEAVQRNDDGHFWKIEREVSPLAVAASKTTSVSVERSREAAAWLRDGLVSLALIAAALGGLAVHVLRGRPRWELYTLLAILVVGAALRLWLAEPHYLGVWAYSRYPDAARRVYFGPALALLSERVGGVYYQVETAFAINLALGVLAPLAVYVHARYLLKRPRAALLTAGMLALLPSHIRFTRSEVAFIPSIVMSSFTFALLHIALTERSRAFRVAALLGLPLVVARMVQVRPLNVLFLALFVGVALYLRADSTPRLRRALVVVVLLLGGIPAAASHLGSQYSVQVGEGMSVNVLLEAFWLLPDPIYNSLLNPMITPTGWLLAAAVGAYLCWRSSPRLAVILLGWILLFHTGHAYVISGEPAMQARYYLHMVVPFLMLAAIAAERLWLERARWFGVLAAYSIACPFIHVGFIRDYAFNDVREFEFVMAQRAQIPEGCPVLEFYSHDGGDTGLRFMRVGSYLEDGYRRQRFESIPIGAALEGDLETAYRAGGDLAAGRAPEELIRPEVQALIDERAGRECLYFYSGLGCAAQKGRDEASAPACEALLQRVSIETVAETRLRSRAYDERVSIGLRDGEEFRLTLYRVTGSHGFRTPGPEAGQGGAKPGP